MTIVSGKKQSRDPTMTHYQSALSILIGEVLADPDLAHQEVFRRMLHAGLQDLIDAEATAKIGAARYERTPERNTRRNGTRPKTLATPAGEVDRRSRSCGRDRSSRACCTRGGGLIRPSTR